MFKNKGISKNQISDHDFQDSEIAVIKKIIREFQRKWDCLQGEKEYEDLLQECLFHWYQNKHSYDVTKGANPQTYLAKVTRNKLQDIVRERHSKKRKANLDTRSLYEPLKEYDDSLELIDVLNVDEISPKNFKTHELVEMNIQIQQVIDQLNPRQRKVCDLLREGYEKADIVKILKVPRTTLNDEFKRIEKIFSKAGLKVYLE